MPLVIRHRAVVAAPADSVWALLSDPDRWTDFELFLSGVEGAVRPLEAAQSLALRARGPIPLRLPAEVRVVEPRRRLGLTVHPVPGVVEDIDHLLLPLARGRTDLEVRVTVSGPLALAAYGPLRVSSALVTRQLARAAEANVVRSAAAVGP